MKKKIFFCKNIKLEKTTFLNLNKFIKFALTNAYDIKENMMAFGLNNTKWKVFNYFLKHLKTNTCIYTVKKDKTIIGFIAIGCFNDWNEITFYLEKKHRNIKNYLNNQYSFTDIIKLFLKNYFENKKDNHIIMWGARYFATISQHLAKKLWFIKGYDIYDNNKQLANKEILSHIFFINKKIFINALQGNIEQKNNYIDLIKDIMKSKWSLIDDKKINEIINL